MKRFLLLVVFCFSFINLYAQLDREHWFAPMVDRVGNSSTYQSIYMSTNEVTPFKVDIYNNNAIISSVTISKNNPVKYSVPRNYIITTSTSDLFHSISKGIYLKGEKPFFSSLRFSINNHGEIVTSKGTAGIGTSFRAVMAPITANNGILNFMTSIMATEDNTTVNINGFNSNIAFADGSYRTQFTFTLNKGQSYIVEGTGNYSTNRNGAFIGAKIVADKPISITNGNFNGQYATTSTNSSDILMDQGVPEDKLGQEFILMKGNGTTGSGMEKAIIVATENNTQIYLNGSTIPSATINTGEYYTTDNNAYILQGFNHYNMRIKTSKNAYVYQLLAGDSGDSMVATGGFNYIPPLSCYLPKRIDEIGLIQENYVVSNGNPGGILNIPTKLNIITERGATISIQRNGTPLTLTAANGPFNVTGTSNWVTYSYPNITGNIAVFSSSAVTAGISAGDDAVGYGGYFAGFSFIPAILKSQGDCLPGVKLEITEGFDFYQWLIKDTFGNYIPAPGINSNYFYEPTQAGIYRVRVKQGSCDEIQTQDFRFYNCTTYTNEDYNNTCTTEVITPKFALSSQILDPRSVRIDTPPTKGTVTIAADGRIIYTANPNQIGIDTFKFSFCGNDTIPDCETVQATIHLNQTAKYDVTLTSCSTNGLATYDLTSANVTPNTNVTKTYFKDVALTDLIPLAQLSNYISADGFVYVKLDNTSGCPTTTAIIELKSKPSPVISPNLYTTTHCDEDIDGIIDGVYKVNVDAITSFILLNPTSYTTRYYDTAQKANTGGNDNIRGVFSFTANSSVWIRVDDPSNICPFTVKEIPLNIGTKISLILATVPKTVCDNDLDNTENINLADYINSFTADPGVTVKYFETLQNAQNNTNDISVNQTVTGDKTFYYRFSKTGLCDIIGTLNVVFKAATPSTVLPASVTVCDGSTTVLNVGTGYTNIVWSTGATTQTITTGAGNYWVDLTNSSGCVYRQLVTVVSSPKPQLNVGAYSTTHCDEDIDGIIDGVYKVNVDAITSFILLNPTSYTTRYYDTAQKANAGGNDNIRGVFSFTANSSVWIRVDDPSNICPFTVKEIPLNIGTKISLILATVPKTVCDNDLDNTENINLADYINSFTADPGVTVKYFGTLQNAQNNTNDISVNQTVTGDKTFYYRFSKTGLCDIIGTLNIVFKAATPSTVLPASVTVCDGSTTVLNVGTGYTNIVWSTGATTQTITTGAGNYWVDLTNSSGCVYRQLVTVVNSPKPQWNVTAYNATHCDDNLDGIIRINLSSEVTPVILPNHTLFIVKYYSSLALANAGGNNNLPNNWSYSANTTIYARAESPYCPVEIKPIDFKIGNSLPLISSIVPKTVCDNDLDNTENINLADYINSFTADPGVTVKYFGTLQNAQNNTNDVSVNQTVTGDKTFYYRFSKTGLCDIIGTLNIVFKAATPSTVLPASVTVCDGSTTVLNVGTGYTNIVWSTGATTQTITTGAGNYWVDLTNSSGCVYRQLVTVVNSPKPQWNVTAYNATHCDDNLDGIIRINLSSEVTPVILPNHTLFIVKYYSSLALANAGGNNNLPNNWSYSANTTIYARAESPYCPVEIKPIDFKIGNPIILTTYDYTADPICDDDLDGIKAVDLSTYISDFTTDTGITVTYFRTLANANNNTNPITNPVTVNNSGTFYLRFHKNNFCDVIGKLNISIKIPKKSDILKDQKICPGTVTILDAGTGFDSYLWSTGETTQSINVPVGDYWVELTFNGCPYKQNVSVTAVALPEIKSIDIQGNTITINVTGGNPPYQYSLNGGNYQSSNVFTNVPSGNNTVSVISADNCSPVTTTITIIPTLNVITPNGDGKNDVLNYSDLLKKDEPMLQIFDRFGRILFKGDQNNRFIWDGKSGGGKNAETGTYWYIMEWKEPGFTTVSKQNGWVLLKNRE